MPLTKPSLLQESRLTGGGSPNLVDLIEWKSLSSRSCELQKMSIHFTHDCTLVQYAQMIQTGSVLLLLPFSSVLGFTLYEDTDHGRAATHQLYSFAIVIEFAPMTSVAGAGNFCLSHCLFGCDQNGAMLTAVTWVVPGCASE